MKKLKIKELKVYGHLRVEDLKLPKLVKIRAAKEGRSSIHVVEQAVKEYLKKPLSE